MNTNRLFEMYNNATFQPALKEGEYKVTMVSHKYVAEPDKTPYIKFEYKIKGQNGAEDRIISDNKFEAGFGVMVSHLRQQLGREDEAIQPIEFFNELIKNETEFSIWVVKRIVNGYPKTNINFLKPVENATTVPNTEVVEDEVEEATEVVAETTKE